MARVKPSLVAIERPLPRFEVGETVVFEGSRGTVLEQCERGVVRVAFESEGVVLRMAVRALCRSQITILGQTVAA